MPRFAGLPCRKSSEQDQSSTRSSTPRLSKIRIRQLLRGGALMLALPGMVAGSALLPANTATPVAASAASFAMTGFVGAFGDTGGDYNDTLATTDSGVFAGTLNFGDPIRGGNPIEDLIGTLTPPTETPAPVDTTAPPEEGQTPPSGDPATPPPAAETPPPAEATPPPAPEAPATPPAAEAPPPAEATPPPAEQPGDDASAQLESRGVRASDIARGLVGRAYRYGGTGPRAFDCSGLTLYIYRQLGINLPHKAAAQYSERYGKRIKSIDALIPGDLVFFKNTAGRGITHAAIYVGGGKMVTANSPRQGVQLQSIHTSYWRSHWAGGVRPGL